MKFLKVLCVLAVALCLTASVYAETQSVKVSGDLTVRSIFRSAYNYQGAPDEDPGATGTMGNIDSPDQSWVMQSAAIQVDADLTDNVQTVIRILNERDWDVFQRNVNATTNPVPNARGGYVQNADEFDVKLDLAYVALKDFIYSPLTVTIGRQDLWFGKGFVVGSNFFANNNSLANNSSVQGNLNDTYNLSAPEYTEMTSFDSVKAVLDYDPWTISGVYAKIYEDAVQANDDVDLWGVNVGYKFDSYKAEAEGYWFWKKDNSAAEISPIKHGNDVHTIGLRGSFDPIDVVTINAEGAYQGGQYIGSRGQLNSRNRSAWALDVGGEWRYLAEKFSWKPKLGAEYVYYSGNKPESNPANATGEYTGWDPMYRGKFDSAIREFVGTYYTTSRYPNRADQGTSSDDASFTNQHQVIFSGSLQPIDSLTLKANYNLFWNQEAYLANGVAVDSAKTQGFIGQEVDFQANWDYTEDVSFGLLAGWFMPGEVYFDNRNDIATDVVGTVKVSF